MAPSEQRPPVAVSAVPAPPAVGVWTDARPEPGEPYGQRRYGELRDEARLADQLGYRTFATTEQHGVDDGYMSAQLTVIAGLAGHTSSIRFLTNALLVLLHPWRNVVEQAIAADLLSDGRLDLGLAVGGYQREFELFGVDMKRRGRLMEQAIPFLRQGLTEGLLPDGPEGRLLPVLPRPAQARIPLYLGGTAPPVIDRAARLADGVVPVDFFSPETAFPRFYEEILQPAMERHGRTLEDLRFTLATSIWATDDPERDWETFYGATMEYQVGKYAQWAGEAGSNASVAAPEWFPQERGSVLIDTPENIAKRLLALRERAPFHEVVFWYRLPGIGHERAMEHLERVQSRVLPLLAAASGSS